LEGAAIDDAVVKLFEKKEKLTHIQFLYTKVTPDAVDALKKRHPDAVVYVRNEALLGISAENHPKGVMVQTVENTSAASAAGIVPGDVITTFGGKPLADFDRLTARIAQHRPGDTVEVEILRGEEQKKISVTLGRWSDRR
jgi:S1-C subfamily serine protease